MYKIKVGYLLELTYTEFEDAQKAIEVLFQGGVDKVTFEFVPIEEVTA